MSTDPPDHSAIGQAAHGQAAQETGRESPPVLPTAPPTEAPPQATRRAPSLVLIATGDGKGKTTAAMGTVLRALGRGWKVCVVQFLKSGKWKSGEARMLSELGAEWHAMGDGFTWEVDDLERSAEMARSAWAVAKEAIGSGRYQLVVLDEITYPVNWGWLPVDDVASSIVDRPNKVNIFVTGRDAPTALVEIADTVTDMRNVKHAYEAGIREAKGIDF
jgi:cob(I)alamin adenosyltransferase